MVQRMVQRVMHVQEGAGGYRAWYRRVQRVMRVQECK